MIPIIFENEDMLVLNKPAGISVHKDGKHDEYTVADYILEHYPQLDGVGEDTLIPEKQEQKIKPKMWKGQIEDPGFAFKTRKERMNQKKQKSEDLSSENSDTESEAEPLPAIKSVIKRPGIVHRLDKETSGCLVIAKNQKSYNHLKKQFHDREVKKEYVAIVYGWPKNDTGIIDTPIARSKSDFRRKEIALPRLGGLVHRGEERDAMTRYKTDAKFSVAVGDREVKLAQLHFYPSTGRMHQIRVHSKSIGHPILADHLYGRQDEDLEQAIFKGGERRHLLHASKITIDGKAYEAPMPGEFLLQSK